MVSRRSRAMPHLSADVNFSFAFQPIVNAQKGEIVSYEALVRGLKGEPSEEVLGRLSKEDLYRFDSTCRKQAIKLAGRLKLSKNLHINLLPFDYDLTNAIIHSTLKELATCGLRPEGIVFELTESQILTDKRHLVNFIKLYREFGFQTAIDDFGSGYSGLKLLAEYQPNYIKFDRDLIADIHENEIKKNILQGITSICRKLNVEVIAEGVEQADEFRWLRAQGIKYFQGYFFAYPAFEALPEVSEKSFSL